MGEFAKNTAFTFITRILQMVIGIITSVVIARTLGPEGRGIYSLVILFPALLINFSDLGIGPATVYYVGKGKYNLKEVFGNNVIYSIAISIIMLFIGLVIIIYFSNSLFPKVNTGLLILSLLLVPFQFFFNFNINILLGLQKIQKYNVANILISVFFTVLIVIFLSVFDYGVSMAVIAQILAFIIGCIILSFWVNEETRGIILKFNKLYFKDSFSYGIKNWLGNISAFLLYRVDVILINIFINPVAVGFYSISVKMAEEIWAISQSAGTVLFPRVACEKDEKSLKEFTPLVCRNILFITFLISIFLLFTARWLIVFLYSNEFLSSIIPFQILLIGAVAMSGWRILANDLYGRGKPMMNVYLSLTSSILNLILNVILIPRYDIAGAAWATSISYTITFLATAVVYSMISGNKIRDMIILKKSDFVIYKKIIISIRNKYLYPKYAK